MRLDAPCILRRVEETTCDARARGVALRGRVRTRLAKRDEEEEALRPRAASLWGRHALGTRQDVHHGPPTGTERAASKPSDFARNGAETSRVRRPRPACAAPDRDRDCRWELQHRGPVPIARQASSALRLRIMLVRCKYSRSAAYRVLLLLIGGSESPIGRRTSMRRTCCLRSHRRAPDRRRRTGKLYVSRATWGKPLGTAIPRPETRRVPQVRKSRIGAEGPPGIQIYTIYAQGRHQLEGVEQEPRHESRSSLG